MDSTPPTLLESLKNSNNKQAWEQFHKLYGQRIWTKTHQILGRVLAQGDWSQDGHQFAADVCQETVIKVFQHLRNFVRQGEGSFRVWLDKIVRHEIVNELRKAGNRSEGWPRKEIDDLCARLTDDRQDIQVFTKDEHDRHLVAIALEWLQKEFPNDKVEIFLRLVRGEAKPDDIAVELGMSVPNIHLLKHRMLKELREHMNQYLADFLD